MEDLEEPLAASLVRGVFISQEPGGSSHQAPSEHNQPQACSILRSLSQDTPSGSTSCYYRASDMCCPSATHSDKYHLSEEMTELSSCGIVVRYGEGRFNTVALSTAQSSLKQKVRTNEVKAHPGYLSLKQGSWSSVPLKVPTSEPPPEAEQASGIPAPRGSLEASLGRSLSSRDHAFTEGVGPGQRRAA